LARTFPSLSIIILPKVLNSTEDAHAKSMSMFETDEHLRAKSVLASVFEADGSLDDGT
jgi:hypothetical protein